MDTCPKSRQKFVDSDKCLDIIRQVHSKLDNEVDPTRCRSDAENLAEKFQRLVDPFQEQPELLEPYLSGLIEELTNGLTDVNISSVRYHTIFKLLYQLIKVTGFKSIGRKFPHETNKLPLLVELLSKEDFQDKYNWQTRFVLTVWLSIVILIPFDLAKFDTTKNAEGKEEEEGGNLTERLYSSLYKSLLQHDSCQHVSAYCMAKFFSRSDILNNGDDDNLVDKFIDESMAELADIKLGSSAGSMVDVKLIGHLRTLAYMFKFLPRQEMKFRCERILNVLTKLDVDKINRELINHIIIKLIQRAGLALLPKPVASWRYKRGSRILGQVGKLTDAENVKQTSTNESNSNFVSSHRVPPAATSHRQEEKDEDEDVISAEYLESILSVLLVACQNSQTRIRWSAAKGIARLSSRLSRERASDVIDMILSNFFDLNTSSEFAWHGGCLTLAEMSRNGLILEEKLEQVIGIISNAIIYDKIKGSFAVGSHVREAACYVCWAMARNYEDHLLAAYISSISINLLCIMLFDRELQCRRAASATFQELVGRQGTFNERGINILNNLDYHNLGQRQLAYTTLAVRVASYSPDEYAQPFVEHLLEKKIGHWDIQIRRLASDSLAALVPLLHSDYIQSIVLDSLMKMIEQTNLDNNSKHGAILGLAKIVNALGKSFEFNQQLIDFMGSIVNSCEKQLKSKQQAGNFIEAIGHVIASCEAAGFHYPAEALPAELSEFEGEKEGEDNGMEECPVGPRVVEVSVVKQWESVALSALDSDNSLLRDIGSDALLTLYKTYYKGNKTCQDRLLTILNKSLNSLNESSRCGGLRALSKLSQVPGEFLETSSEKNKDSNLSGLTYENAAGSSRIRLDSDTPNIILMSIIGYIAKETHERGDNIVFAQAKAEACEALVNFVGNLDKARLLPLLNLIRASYEALLEKTEDYTLDKRGDIGVVVRQASIRALLGLTIHLQSINLTSIMFVQDHESATNSCCLIQRIITKFLQQSVSYHNSARELASTSFYKLITLSSIPDELIPHRAFILSLFEEFQVNEQFNWRDDSTPIFVKLLTKQEYNLDLWTGLLSSLGANCDSSAKPFRDALADYLRSLSKNQDGQGKLEIIFNAFLECLERTTDTTIAGERLLTSGLITTDYLLSQGLLNESNLEFQEKLANFCWQARLPFNGTKPDPKRLVVVGRVLSSMLQLSGKVQIISLKYCLQLLVSGFARVRVSMAEQFYLSLMTYESELEENLASVAKLELASACGQSGALDAANLCSASASEGGELESGLVEEEDEEESGSGIGKKFQKLDLSKAMELLSETDWSEPLEILRPVRDQVSACLGLP